MSARKTARKRAFYLIYESEVRAEDLCLLVENREKEASDDANNEPLPEYSREICLGVAENRDTLFEKLAQNSSTAWGSRFAKTDLAILLVGAYELLYTSVPKGVIIDECIKLAKDFGAKDDSYSLIQAILDKIS